MVINNDIKYFLPGPIQEIDRRARTEIGKQLQCNFEDILSV